MLVTVDGVFDFENKMSRPAASHASRARSVLSCIASLFGCSVLLRITIAPFIVRLFSCFITDRMSRSESRLYVGNLPPDCREKDIEDLFLKYGKITFVDLKNRRPPPFAFVEYDDPRCVLHLCSRMKKTLQGCGGCSERARRIRFRWL